MDGHGRLHCASTAWSLGHLQPLAETALEFPPMQKGGSFNLEAVKEQIEKAVGTTRQVDQAQPALLSSHGQRGNRQSLGPICSPTGG